MKRLLILLMLFAAIAVGALLSPIVENPTAFAQTNTFCAANLTCTVSASWIFSSTLTAGSFNNIRIVDGTKFAQSAAGINAADADLGSSAAGEIWVPPGAITATDAQISIGGGHILKVFGRLTIDAVNKGPILLGKYSRLTCAANNTGGGAGGAGTIVQSGTGTLPSMVAATVNDGSLETFYVDYCQFDASSQGVTNGVIDITGMNDKGFVRDNLVYGYTSGWGLFAKDIQTGAAAGTSNSDISGNWFLPTGGGSGGCIFLSHSATNAVIMQTFTFRNNECQLSSSTIATAPILFQNLSAGNINLRLIQMDSMFIQGVPVGQPGITINGLLGSTFKNIWCGGAGPCINIPTNTDDQSLAFENITNLAATNTLVDTGNSVTITNATIAKYVFINSNAPTQTLDTTTNIFRVYGTGAFSIGSDSGFNRIDSAGAAGRLYRFLNTGNGNDGFKALGFSLTGNNTTAAAASIADCRGNNASFQLECNFNNVNSGSYFPMGQTGNTAGTHSDSGFYQTASAAGCTTAASIGGVCATPVTITWPVAFADANYKVTCQGSGAITNFPIMGSVTARVAANATVQTMALTAAAASFTTIECTAVHN